MKFIPHSRPSIGKDDIKAVSKVLASGMIAQGKKVEDFEKAIARKCKVKYTVAVSSGSAALHLALMALEIGKEDAVAIPSYSCTALLNAILYVGASPKFIDIDPETLNISPEDLKKKITRRVKAVIVPHMFGFPADILEIKKLGLPIIEDCALALGAQYRGKPAGYWGDISVFSFYATKVIATGEGGMITTHSKSLADYIKDIREYDRPKNFRIRYNYKMTDMAAALGLSQLSKLDVFLKKREEIASYYDYFFYEKKIQNRKLYTDRKPIHYRYILKTKKDVKGLIKKLKRNGVTAELPVYRPLHHFYPVRTPLTPVGGNYKIADGSVMLPSAESRSARSNGVYQSSHICRVTDEIWKSVYSIPIYPSLTNTERQQIVRVVKSYDS